MAGLKATDLHKTFGDTVAVRQVSFSVAEGEIVAILGPSGCGKSTVLHVIAGLEEPDRGQVLWNGQSMQGVPPHQRQFGLMFQEFALFPHMSVADNITFGLRMRDMDPEEIAERLAETLELVGLPGHGERSVEQLSGGERQRVALARSLAPEPRLLMLDEPLGSLDRTLKERLMLELPQILRRTEQTVLYVTHDQEEAFAVADRVIVMRAGEVAQIGRPAEIYREPNSPFVAEFLGLDNLLSGQAEPAETGSKVQTRLGTFDIDESLVGEVTLLVRPEAARLDGEGDWELTGELVERSFRGGSQRAVLRLEEDLVFSFDFSSSDSLPPLGQTVTISLPLPDSIQVLA